eukprot:COSAG05_NODE_807_length_7192_cov_92.394191_8_plen_98_part_00
MLPSCSQSRSPPTPPSHLSARHGSRCVCTLQEVDGGADGELSELELRRKQEQEMRTLLRVNESLQANSAEAARNSAKVKELTGQLAQVRNTQRSWLI